MPIQYKNTSHCDNIFSPGQAIPLSVAPAAARVSSEKPDEIGGPAGDLIAL
jgi:hypothetical protein